MNSTQAHLYGIVLVVFIVLVVLAVITRMWASPPWTGGVESSRLRGPLRTPDRLKNLLKWPASRAENIVRSELEKITGETFPTVYPSWLDGLELDGYNSRLGLAFEFQGPQHTRFDSKYDREYSSYYERLLNDYKKVKKCRENGVFLIIIDYIIPRHLLNIYLRSRLYDFCREYPQRCTELPLAVFDTQPPNYLPVIYHRPYRNESLESSLESIRIKTSVFDYPADTQ